MRDAPRGDAGPVQADLFNQLEGGKNQLNLLSSQCFQFQKILVNTGDPQYFWNRDLELLSLPNEFFISAFLFLHLQSAPPFAGSLSEQQAKMAPSPVDRRHERPNCEKQ